MNIENLTIKKTRKGLVEKDFSAVELVKSFLERIKKRNKKINAVLTLNEEGSLAKAKEIDKLISRGENLPSLAGIPCLVKDNIMVKELKCTAGSKILSNYIAPYNASVVNFLEKEGSIVLGKANLDEFAVGSSGEYSAFGPTLNPFDTERVAGGSSSGPGASVGDNQCVFSIGSDTGGSIRLPAAFCGAVGFKPTYGAVSRYGLIAMASSLDQIGPVTKNVEDAKLVFKSISAFDKMDSTKVNRDFSKNLSKKSLKDLKLGVPKELFPLSSSDDSEIEKAISKEVKEKTKESIEKMKKEGVQVKEISLPSTSYALAVYYIIMSSELSSNLARYDGIKYGYSVSKEEIKNLDDVYLKSRGEGFGEEIRRRIMLGTYALSSGYYDEYYARAQKIRTLIRNEFEKAFKEVDFILTPASPTLPFKLGEKIANPISMYLSDVFMIPANLAGLPALSLPVSKCGDLPLGIHLMGQRMEDLNLLEAASLLEKIYA
jgi:aspartyl-tRNA(Asn)/glutamyl-tRNA(Gln) amidotransferase subunit A